MAPFDWRQLATVEGAALVAVSTLFGLALSLALGRLFRPDNFPGDWRGWGTNQAAHICVGLMFAALVSIGWIVLATEAPPRAPLALACLGWAGAFEVAQLVRFRGSVPDKVADVFFLSVGGVTVAVAGSWVAGWSVAFDLRAVAVGVIAALLVMSLGIWRRA